MNDIKPIIRQLLESIEGKPSRPELKRTPERVQRAIEEMLDGYDENIDALFETFGGEGKDQIVSVGDIRFTSFCVAQDTLIATPRGNIPIQNLVGTEPYVYGWDEKRDKLCLRRAKNIRLTRHEAEVVFVETGKGGIFLTPEHRILLRTREFVPANQLNFGDSLMSFTRYVAPYHPHKVTVTLTDNKTMLEPRFVYEEVIGRIPTGYDIHHIDGDETNNLPENLCVLTRSKHQSLEMKLGRARRAASVSNSLPTAIEKRRIGILNFYQTEKGIRNREEKSKSAVNQWKRQKQMSGGGRNDTVISVSPAGKRDVYNMEVEEVNNFIANNIVVHNCEHHILPWTGIAYVAYLPVDRVIGVSKIGRLVLAFAHRLQLQERLTKQIAYTLMDKLKPQGVAVIIIGEHMCMRCRGVKLPQSQVRTSEMLGEFREDRALRQEVLALLGLDGE